MSSRIPPMIENTIISVKSSSLSPLLLVLFVLLLLLIQTDCVSVCEMSRTKTRSGKDVEDSESSDMYLTNTMPPKALLLKKNVDFVDEQGRMYWDAKRVSSGAWKWSKLEEVLVSAQFNKARDRVFFFRNPAGVSMLDLPPLETSLQDVVFFYDIRLTGVAKYKGFITDNGNDELQAAMMPKTGKRRETTKGNTSAPRVRQTSYVVISDLEELLVTKEEEKKNEKKKSASMTQKP